MTRGAERGGREGHERVARRGGPEWEVEGGNEGGCEERGGRGAHTVDTTKKNTKKQNKANARCPGPPVQVAAPARQVDRHNIFYDMFLKHLKINRPAGTPAEQNKCHIHLGW